MAPLSIKKETGLPAISRVTLGSNAVMADGAGGPGLCQSSVAKPRSPEVALVFDVFASNGKILGSPAGSGRGSLAGGRREGRRKGEREAKLYHHPGFWHQRSKVS